MTAQQAMDLGISSRNHNRRWRLPLRIAVAVVAGLASLAPVPAMAAKHPPKPHPNVFAYVASNDGHVYVIDTKTSSVLAIGTITIGGGPDQVAVTPDGATLYVTNFFKFVSAINIAKKSTTNINYDQSFAADILDGEAITPDGKHVYVAVGNTFHGDKVSVIDTTTNQISDTIKISRPDLVAISPNGKRAYVACDSGVSVINTTTDQIIATIPLNEAPTGMAITPDGKRLFVTGASGNVSVINIAKRKIVHTIPDAGTGGVAISPNGKRAYVTGAYNNPAQGKVSIINTATDTVTTSIAIGEALPTGTGSGRYFLPSQVAITPDGKSVYVTGSYGNGSKQGTVFVIDTATKSATAITVGTSDTQGVAIGRL